MSSFLDCEYKWQHRPDETTASLTNPISTTTTTSVGPLPSYVGSCSYGITSDRNAAATATTTTATATATIKSEQAMLLDDDETADDDNDTDTAGSRYKNYNYDDDFDSSDDEAIIARMKMTTKKKKKDAPHSSDATTSHGNGHSTLREELVTNNNNVVPMTTLPCTSSNTSKSEQAMLLDAFDFDSDSSDDEAIVDRMKMAAKKKKKNKETPHASDATASDRSGYSTLYEELNTNNNNGVPMTTVTRTTYNISNEVVDKYSSTSCLLLNSYKDDGMVASISRDDNDDHGYDNDDIGDDHGNDDDSTFQRSEGIKRKRHEKNPGNTTDRNDKRNVNSDSKDNVSDNNVYSAKRIRVEVDEDILFPSSLPVMSNSHQAVQDVRFCNNEGDGGGAVSGTASSEQRFDSNPALRPRNAKSTKSTNIIASDGGFHENISQGHAKPSSKNSTKWEEYRQQLADFKVKFLHTNVPAKHAENKALGIWVDNQRVQYMLFKAKRKSYMTRERIQSLEELDFEWKSNTTRTWEESRQQLVDFKRKFLHTNVPNKFAENKPLGNWVKSQRKWYKLFKAKRKSYITRERIQSLEELDFEWERITNRCTWEERRQQLVDFKRKFRHTNVPRDYAKNKPLGNWVNTQRIQYRLFKANNNKSFMTRERIQSLKELDFKWQLGRGGRRTRSNSSSLVESSLSKTEDGYESDNSELYVII